MNERQTSDRHTDEHIDRQAKMRRCTFQTTKKRRKKMRTKIEIVSHRD